MDKINHRRAADFSSVYANGVISSIVPNSGLFNLTFYEDVVGIVSETVDDPDAETSTTSFQDGDLEQHREDKVRVSMTPETALRLMTMLKDRLEQMGMYSEPKH